MRLEIFTIWDLDFNEIPLPMDELGLGLTGVDLIVSSVSQEVRNQSGARRPGNYPTGYRDDTRAVTLKVNITAYNSTDYRMKRDVLYNFFSCLGTFYVSETQQGNKLLKVRSVESYTPERPEGFQTIATVDIPLITEGAPYWVSRNKSMDLNARTGISTDGGWSVGMGLGVFPDKLMYRYWHERRFGIFNPGKELHTILEKGDCLISIQILDEPVLSFSLEDATGNRFEYNKEKDPKRVISPGYFLELNGHDIAVTGSDYYVNRLADTNRYYPVILKGDNEFRIRGMTRFLVVFDFRFKYY